MMLIYLSYQIWYTNFSLIATCNTIIINSIYAYLNFDISNIRIIGINTHQQKTWTNLSMITIFITPCQIILDSIHSFMCIIEKFCKYVTLNWNAWVVYICLFDYWNICGKTLILIWLYRYHHYFNVWRDNIWFNQ